jgi:hypothetical protein
VILAFGELNESMGLPDFNGVKITIESGKMAAMSLSMPQVFEGKGNGGLGYYWIWSHKPVES